LEVPNGVYEITLGLGDKSSGNLDSRHTATVEGYSIIPAFVPQDTETRVSTMVVEVTDGLLTMNGLGGYNSKITHITVTATTDAPVNGNLVFEPASIQQTQESGLSGSFISVLNGEGAGEIGLAINDNINNTNRNATGTNDWLTLPTSVSLGEITFNSDTSNLVDGDTRENTVIATAKGFRPAVLNTTLIVQDALSDEKAILNFTLTEQTTQAVIDASAFTVAIEVLNGTDLTTLSPEITISEDASLTPVSGTVLDFTEAVTYTVTAQDESTQNWIVSITESPEDVVQNCSPISTLPCEEVVVNLPVNLDFNASYLNTILDNNGNGTGFTAVMEHAEARRSGDLPISNPEVNGYEPSLLSLSSGALELISQAGINYLNPSASSNNNNQVNTLGVGIQNIDKPITIETSLQNIVTGTGSAQAGIWFGFDEDNFVKLNVVANNVELRKEVGSVSVNGASSPDQIQVDEVGVAGQNVTLRMVIDPVLNTITGFYSIDGGAFIQVTKNNLSALSLPASYLNGRNLNNAVQNVSFAGIYATHRNGSQFTARFDDFSATIEEEDLALLFNKESLTFESLEGEDPAIQTVDISATSGNPSFSISDDPSSGDWLILPTNPVLGTLEFGIQPGLEANTYSTTLIAIPSDDNYASAELQVSLVVTAVGEGSDQNDIASFELVEATGPAVLNLEGHLIDIEVEKGTDLSSLSPVIIASEGATISPESGVAQDFTSPVLYTVTAENGTVQEWSVRVKEAVLFSFAFIENFDTYGTGNLHEIAGGVWSRESTTDAVIPVLNQGISKNTEFSLDFSGGQQAHDYETLIENPIELSAGQAFYFATYFNVADLGGATNRVRAAVRIDDDVTGDQWIREQIAFNGNNELIARIGLEGAGSNQGIKGIEANKSIQFLTRGIWDGLNTITYSWTIAPMLNLEQTEWTDAGTHTVQGTPRLGRVFISSNGTNDAKLGPLRLATNYAQVVTEEGDLDKEDAQPLLVLSTQEIIGDAIVDNTAAYVEEVTISNNGDAVLNDIEIIIAGENPEDFTVVGLPESVAPQENAIIEVVFRPVTVGPKYASLQISAASVESQTISLKGLGKKGLNGNNEPSLQWILDTQLERGAIAVGDTDASTNLIDLESGKTYNDLLGDELDIKRFERAASGQVTLEVLSAFGPQDVNPVTAFGWYESGEATSLNEVFTITNASGNGQTLNPVITGESSFYPGVESFGFYSKCTFFNDRILFSEDALNTFNGAVPHHVRVYALPGEENAYIIATEEHVSGFDYQDIVVIARNI
ncbi:MAG: DUF5018 domain-containing protein, partial [Leeuwenhoekiella sp.]